jgi:hypothetical protein
METLQTFSVAVRQLQHRRITRGRMERLRLAQQPREGRWIDRLCFHRRRRALQQLWYAEAYLDGLNSLSCPLLALAY